MMMRVLLRAGSECRRSAVRLLRGSFLSGGLSQKRDVWARRAFFLWLLSAFAVVSLSAPVAAERCHDLAKAPHTRWKTESRKGVQWLVTPCGELFFSVGVNVVDGGAKTRENNGRIFYSWVSFSPDLKSWAQEAARRMRHWGFNTAGAWSLSPTFLGMPEVIDLALGRTSLFHWVDPFDPVNLERMRQVAREQVAPFKGSPYRIGYFTDNEVGWWNGPLFTVFSAYPPENYTKQRLVTLLRDRYADNWHGFVKDFVPPADVQSFSELLKGRAKTQLRPGGQGIHVVRQWTAIVAEQYYRTATQAVREADPDALILGDRLPIYYDPDAVRVMAPYVDVISVNYNLDAPNGWVAPYFFTALGQLSRNKPVLISEWFFAAHENRSGNLNRTGYPNEAGDFDRSSNINLTGHLMTVQTQDERARGAAAGAQRLAGMPNIVGLHWFQYYDHPKGGRDDGEDYNFGLVDINDRPYEKLTEAFRRLHPTLGKLHEKASRSRASAWAGILPHAELRIGDNSLTDWPLDTALVPLRTKPAEAVFGDLYVSWSGNGLNLATISMDYYDPELLSYQGDFPLSEAFRIDLGLDAGSGVKRFAVLVIPEPPAAPKTQTFFRTVLCRVRESSCEPVAGAQTSFFGIAMDQPRVILEALLPWSALGLQGAPRGKLRMAAAITAFYRSRWMSTTGVEPGRLFAKSGNWPMVQLQSRK
jgi:hypothetical protein